MEIVFYDLETTIPQTDMIEFGAIVLDGVSFVEIESYSTLIRSDRITQLSIDCNGITPEMVAAAPAMVEVAEKIYSMLDGRVWAGHNINRFDNPVIRKSFARIGMKPPKPLACIDTYPLLRSTFAGRTDGMSLAALGQHFGLGEEKHRSLDDCRMNIEVIKSVGMTLLLEQHANYSLDMQDSSEAEEPHENCILYEIALAMREGRDTWIVYSTGLNSDAPRQIKPIRWVHEPFMLEALCHRSGRTLNFTQSKILDARSNKWNNDECKEE